MDKTCRIAKEQYDTFSSMLSYCFKHLRNLEEENPQNTLYFDKIRKDCEKLCIVYRKRMMEKFYKVYGGPTPFDEPIDDVKLYPDTCWECLEEYRILENIYHYSIQYLVTFFMDTAEAAISYTDILEDCQKAYQEYQKEIQKRIEEILQNIQEGTKP